MKTSATINQMELVSAIFQELSRQMPGLELVPRQMNTIIDAADKIVKAISIPEIQSVPGEGIARWRNTDQVGRSSDFMAAKLGNAGIRPYAHPHDPADFGRCLTLLKAAPELRERLPMMADESPEWAALVENWDELEALWNEESPTGYAPKLYDRMQELLRRNHESDNQP